MFNSTVARKLLWDFDRGNHLIPAIKYLREQTNFGLGVAKHIVEAAWEQSSDSTLRELILHIAAQEDSADNQRATIGACVPAGVSGANNGQDSGGLIGSIMDKELCATDTILGAMNSLPNNAARSRVLTCLISRLGYRAD
jgi:hypothetical protein